MNEYKISIDSHQLYQLRTFLTNNLIKLSESNRILNSKMDFEYADEESYRTEYTAIQDAKKIYDAICNANSTEDIPF